MVVSDEFDAFVALEKFDKLDAFGEIDADALDVLGAIDAFDVFVAFDALYKFVTFSVLDALVVFEAFDALPMSRGIKLARETEERSSNDVFVT